MEQEYLNLVKECIDHGDFRLDRTNIGTYSLFGPQLTFNLQGGIIPLLTTKKIAYKVILKELLWFIKGSTNVKDLNSIGVFIWNANGSRKFLDSQGFYGRLEGDLGPIYGFQWRHAGAKYIDCNTDYTGQGIDQLKETIEKLKTDPSNRRIIMNSWNVSQISEMALPPCHCMVQFFVREKKYLDCKLFQRSADLGLGVPFNIASYSFLIYVLSKWCNLTPGKLIHSFGDVHVYSTHINSLKVQLTRKPKQFPTIKFMGGYTLQDLDNQTIEECCDKWCDSFKIINYNYYPTIKMDMAV